MEQLDNQVNKVIDKLKNDIRKGSTIYIISSNFSIFAYDELKNKLNNVEKVYFLFSHKSHFTTNLTRVREFEITTSLINIESVYEL